MLMSPLILLILLILRFLASFSFPSGIFAFHIFFCKLREKLRPPRSRNHMRKKLACVLDHFLALTRQSHLDPQ